MQSFSDPMAGKVSDQSVAALRCNSWSRLQASLDAPHFLGSGNAKAALENLADHRQALRPTNIIGPNSGSATRIEIKRRPRKSDHAARCSVVHGKAVSVIKGLQFTHAQAFFAKWLVVKLDAQVGFVRSFH